jgi:signal transduction histidine kinase
MFQFHLSSLIKTRSRSRGALHQEANLKARPLWLSVVAWGIPASLTLLFLSLGFDAPLIDLATRGLCVGMAAYIGLRFASFQLLPIPQPIEQESQPPPPPSLRQLTSIHKALSTLHIPVLLQQFIEEMAKLIPSRGSLLILLDRRQEEPEYVVTQGQASTSVGNDILTLLPREVFLEVLEQQAVIFNSPRELQDRITSRPLKEFARHNLLVASIRRRQHLAFLLIADRVGEKGFLPQDLEIFTSVAEGAALAIENARLFSDLRETEQKHRELLHGLVNAQEQESKQIATEWQDRISRKLFDVFQGLRSFLNVIAQRAPENEERFRQLTAEIDEIAALVRGLANKLHPTVLDDFGLAAAIREYIADAVAGITREEPLQVTVQADDVDEQLPNEAKLTIFRITQEALRNIRRHAEAKNVQIAFVQEHAGVSIMIKDDGKGFNPDQPHPGHFGLQYMRERAEACGGTFQVVSAQGQGTEVRVNFPGTSRTDQPL